MNIPQSVKDNLAWSLVAGAGFLFVFYVNNTYMTHEAYARETSQVERKLDNIMAELRQQAIEDKRNLAIDGLQDAIADCEDEILALSIYIEEAPDSNLTGARKRRVRILETEKAKLERELAQTLQGD